MIAECWPLYLYLHVFMSLAFLIWLSITYFSDILCFHFNNTNLILSLRRPQHNWLLQEQILDLLLNSRKIYWKVWHLLTSALGIMERVLESFDFLQNEKSSELQLKTLNLFLYFSVSPVQSNYRWDEESYWRLFAGFYQF